nr:hypothetical protein [Micromonospora sp. DSM 115978]
MGTSGNGDGWPDSGASDDLPDLPSDWGPIVIPDDLTELAAEASLVRRELRRTSRRQRWRRRLDLLGPSSLRLSLLIMSVAVLATLASLFAAVLSGQPRQNPTRAAPTGQPGRILPALDMVGEQGETVPVRSLLPAMIIFVNGCDCAEVVDTAARTAPPGVTVIALTSGRAQPTPIPRQPTIVAATVRSLADPTTELRGWLRLAPQPGSASAILVGPAGQLTRTLPTVTSAEDYRVDLLELAAR